MKNKQPIPKKTKQPWPTKAAMEQIYTKKLWGSNGDKFYSGEGSHQPVLIYSYLNVLISFLESFTTPLTVCDLGCGDFNIGKKLVKHAKQYIAVDIVPDMITHHKENFKQDNLEFHCLDIATDELPQGDCALVRQVLQHLSNTEVQAVLSKLTNFKYIILTEHLPQGDFTPNKDIISGQGIRLKKQSGVDILAAPFNFKATEEKELVRSILPNAKGVIVTTLYTVF